MLTFHLFLTSVLRFAKDRGPALRVETVVERDILLKRCWGDGVRWLQELEICS